MSTFARRRVALVAAAVLLAGLAGCGKFFQNVAPTPTPTGGSGTSTSGCTDCVFVSNNLDLLFSYSLSTNGTLTQAGSVNLGYAANAIAVSPKYPYVYVGDALNESVVSYSLSTAGVLTAANNGATLVNSVAPVAMTIDPTGSYLFILGEGATCPDNSAHTCFTLSSLALNSTGGIATNAQLDTVSIEASSNDAAARQVVVSPAGTTLYASLGTGGIAVFGVTSGTLATSGNLYATDTAGLTSVNGLALDSTGTYLYAGLSGPNGGLAVFATASGLTAVPNSPFTISGDQNAPSDYGVTLAGGNVYVSNADEGTISGFTTASVTAATSSTPTPLTGSPYVSSTVSGTSNTVALVTDSSGGNIIALNTLGSPDVQVFSVGTDGSLTATSAANTGTNNATGGPVALAASFTGT